MSWTIRDERPGDFVAIAALTQAAFRDAEHSDGTEPAIVERLRTDGDLTLSLVAEDGELLGHAAFSPVTVSDGSTGWYGLGPVSVSPHRQREGIGSALIRVGLERLRVGCGGLQRPRTTSVGVSCCSRVIDTPARSRSSWISSSRVCTVRVSSKP